MIRSYSAAIIVGFLLALRYALVASRRQLTSEAQDGRRRITPDDVLDASLVGLVAGILGTRVVYVIANWQEFSGHWLSVFAIWKGGLSFIGAPLFGFGYAWWFARRRGISFLSLADLGAPGFALASAVGRIGCYFNGCCYGHECSLPWAVRFPMEGCPGVLTLPSHPAQLYEAALQLGLFLFLHLRLRGRHREGEVLASYLALYCLVRSASEQFRKGATADLFVLGLTHAQVFCLVLLPVFAYAWWRLSRHSGRVLPEAGPSAQTPHQPAAR